MILPVLLLLQLSVQATDSNDAFESEMHHILMSIDSNDINAPDDSTNSDDAFKADVHDILMNIDSNDINAPDDSTNFKMNIEPTEVLPTRIFPAFPFHSTQTVNDGGEFAFRCNYAFHLTESPYQLRPGFHDTTNLGLALTEGAIRIKAPKQCVPEMALGHVSETTDNDMATFVLYWSIHPKDSQIWIHLPMMVDEMPCEYTLVKSSISTYQKEKGRCLPEFHMDPSTEAREMPLFLSTTSRSPKISTEMCWYGRSNRSPIPHWLRVGDHRIVKEASRVLMEVQTQRSCIPLIYRWDGSQWVPFGSVKDHTSISRLPSGPRRQDTTYLLNWDTTSIHSNILIHFPPYANGRACYYEFETALIGVKKTKNERCSSEFTLTY